MATSKSTILDFLAQKANIAGSLLASTTLVAGVLLDVQTALVLGLGVVGYLAGFFLAGEPKQSLSLVAASSEVELRTIQMNIAKLRLDMEQHSKSIPDEIIEASENIFRTLEDIIPRWTEMNSFGEQKYTINSVITEYFPEIITSYMNLPKSYYRNGTKNKAAEAIMEQLGILQKVLDEIRDSVFEGVEKNIHLQSQFLKDKFVTNQDSGLRL